MIWSFGVKLKALKTAFVTWKPPVFLIYYECKLLRRQRDSEEEGTNNKMRLNEKQMRVTCHLSDETWGGKHFLSDVATD